MVAGSGRVRLSLETSEWVKRRREREQVRGGQTRSRGVGSGAPRTCPPAKVCTAALGLLCKSHHLTQHPITIDLTNIQSN